MGQTVAKVIISDLQIFKDELVKECSMRKEIAELTYDHFMEMIKELNKIFQQTEDKSGHTLFFMVKGSTDNSILWKGTVRISCVKVEKSTKKLQCFKLLRLEQFLQAYKMITHCIKPWVDESEEHDESTADSTKIRNIRRNPISASMILNQIDGKDLASDMEECIVCMERKPEITLPCAHSYCLSCIEQWNVSNKTCPVCREVIENPDDSWVLPDIPDSKEVSEELTKLMEEFPYQVQYKT